MDIEKYEMSIKTLEIVKKQKMGKKQSVKTTGLTFKKNTGHVYKNKTKQKKQEMDIRKQDGCK